MPELTLQEATALVEKAFELEALTSWDSENATEDLIFTTAKDLSDQLQIALERGSGSNPVVAELAALAKIEAGAQAGAFDQETPVAPATDDASPPSKPAPLGSSDVDVTDNGVETQASQEQGIDSIYPRYDEQSEKQIIATIIDSVKDEFLSLEEWEEIKAYEKANKNRPLITGLDPFFVPDEPAEVKVVESEQTATEFFANGAQEEPDAGDTVEAFYHGETISRAEQEGIPFPTKMAGTAPVLPVDLTGLSDQELSQLGTAFHSWFAFTQVLQSQEEGRERAAEHLEHEFHHEAYAKSLGFHSEAIPSDKRTAAAIENARRLAAHDADGDQKVRTYRGQKVRHAIDARELKALASTFDKAVWRVDKELDRRARLSVNSAAVR